MAATSTDRIEKEIVEAFRMNSHGWAEQVQNIATYVGQAA
jgi:hypothetical protein